MIDSLEVFKEGLQQKMLDTESKFALLHKEVLDMNHDNAEKGKLMGEMIDAVSENLMVVTKNQKTQAVIVSNPTSPPKKRDTGIKASDFADKTVRHILDFEVRISNYFTDQVRDYIQLLESPFTRHHKAGENLDTLL